MLVTGAHGFIGKHIVQKLRNKYILLTPSKKQLNLLNEVEVDKYFNNNSIKTVVHTAVVGGSRKEEHVNNALSDNLRMFFNLAKNEKYFNKLIYLGSGAEYGKDGPLIKVKEGSFGNNIPKDDYGLYKFICSKYIQQSRKIVNLRIFGLFGIHEDYRYRFISNAICKSLFNLPITINQNVFFDYVYINDFINIVDYFITHKPKHKYYNIGKGQKTDLITLANIVNEVSNKKTDIVINIKGLNNEYTCNNSRLKREMGKLMFTDDKIAIKEMYSWYKRNKRSIKKRLL